MSGFAFKAHLRPTLVSLKSSMITPDIVLVNQPSSITLAEWLVFDKNGLTYMG